MSIIWKRGTVEDGSGGGGGGGGGGMWGRSRLFKKIETAFEVSPGT